MRTSNSVSNRYFSLLTLQKNIFIFYLFVHLKLIIGNFGLSYEQAKLQFALWAIMASVSIGTPMERKIMFFLMGKALRSTVHSALLFQFDYTADFIKVTHGLPYLFHCPLWALIKILDLEVGRLLNVHYFHKAVG